MNIIKNVSQQEDYTLLGLQGEIDLHTSNELRNKLLELVPMQALLMVDLASVAYIDSSGVACLVEAYQLSRTQNRRFALVGLSEAALNVLRLAHLDQVFPIFDSMETCLQHD